MSHKKTPTAALGLSLCLLGCIAAGALAVEHATTTDGPAYPVTTIRLTYAVESPGQPDPDALLNTTVTLTKTPTGFIAPRPADHVSIKLADVALMGAANFHGSAIRAICVQLVQQINDMGLVGIYIRPDPQEIDDAGNDLRTGPDQSLMLIVHTALVAQQRTLAQGERVDPHNGINHPRHEHIIENSPLKTGNLVDKKTLDRYTYWLSRHPGRLVDIALGAAATEGGAVVDYIVTESKPWSVYLQIANNGTDSTGEWRQRLGYVNNQMTNDDDILRLDFFTNGFDGTNAFVGSYEKSMIDLWNWRWRWRISGAWSQFAADNFGITGSDRFEGEQWWIANDVIFNVFQYGQLFIDAVTGFRYQDISVDNFAAGTFGQTTFLLPHTGVNLERVTDLAVTTASIDLQMNLPDLGGTEETDLVRLGRTDVESDFMIFAWSAYQSFFLEPLLWHGRWSDPSTPASSTLAHEIALSFRGQHTLGDRVAPQFEGVIGGMYTVRGYEESTAAGDTTVIFTAEYRLHVPRLFPIDSNPYDTMIFGKPFRWAPQEVYGRPDWDLILRGFFDVGRAIVEAPMPSTESNQTLMSAGIGAEFSFRRNVNLRADYGWALEEAGDTQSGDGRLHLTATLLY